MPWWLSNTCLCFSILLKHVHLKYYNHMQEYCTPLKLFVQVTSQGVFTHLAFQQLTAAFISGSSIKCIWSNIGHSLCSEWSVSVCCTLWDLTFKHFWSSCPLVSLLCTLRLIGLVLLYIVVGMVVNAIRGKREPKQLFPNYLFWKGLPHLLLVSVHLIGWPSFHVTCYT